MADDTWTCPRCRSNRWVAASLTGPVEYGGRAIKQCVPCGYYSGDPVEGHVWPPASAPESPATAPTPPHPHHEAHQAPGNPQQTGGDA